MPNFINVKHLPAEGFLLLDSMLHRFGAAARHIARRTPYQSRCGRNQIRCEGGRTWRGSGAGISENIETVTINQCGGGLRNGSGNLSFFWDFSGAAI